MAFSLIQYVILERTLCGFVRGSPSGSTERLAPCPPSAVFAHVSFGGFCTQPPPFTYAIRSVLSDGHSGSRRGLGDAECRVQSTEGGVRCAMSIILLINLQLLAHTAYGLQPIYLKF